MHTLILQRLNVRDLRNLARLDLTPAPRLNVIAGNNGQGKTSLLEAIYFAATSRSFRTRRPAELIRHGATIATASAHFVEADDISATPIAREQVAAARSMGTSVRINGTPPVSLGAYATRSPVVVFHSGELALSTGPASARRTLLDRLALFLVHDVSDHRTRYARALRTRQQLLHRALGGALESPEIEAFEELCAIHGAALTRARTEAAQTLDGELRKAFRRLAAPDVTLSTSFVSGGAPDVHVARSELRRLRNRDAHRSTPTFGPHRDDLDLSFDGHAVRLVGSQGQHRALTLALKAAELSVISTARGLEPILLLDDVSSELDADRTAALFASLGLGQIFLTTTRRELIHTPLLEPASRCDFRLDAGVLRVG